MASFMSGIGHLHVGDPGRGHGRNALGHDDHGAAALLALACACGAATNAQPADAPDEYDVKSNVSVMYTDGDGHAHVLAVGTYEDRVRVGPGEARFVRKRVILDNFTTPRYIVYPL